MKNMQKWLSAAVMIVSIMVLCTVCVPERFALTAYAAAGDTYTVRVDSGYLALRSAKAYDYSNEIGKLYTGEVVQAVETGDPQYWWVYAPSLGKYGYVNKDYLVGASSGNSIPARSFPMTARVSSGYLALRNAKAYDYSNEIGEIYSGETVYVVDTSEGLYWWVYAPTLGLYGYVNSDYLVGNIPSSYSSVSSNVWTVRVDSGYLALRTAKAFDSANEIGSLYTGQTVQVIDTSEGKYWWVYAPTLGKYGYVNSDYLVNGGTYTYGYASNIPKTVRVQSGYLALRTAKAFDSSNEIGELYTGQTVYVQDASDSQYWWVYAPTLGKYGYVNKDYLY